MKSVAETDENVVETFVNRSNKNAELTAAISLYRHQCELKKIEAEMEANKPIPTQNENKVKRAIIDNTVNTYRRWETQKLSEKKKACLDKVEAFKAKCKEDGIELKEVTEESLRQTAEAAFAGDDSGMQKTCYAMLLCLQGESEDGEYIYGDETLKDISKILFDDEMRIKRIKEKFFENYKEISGGSFWERNKYLLIGAGISLALVAVLTPIAVSASALAGCLAEIGCCVPWLIGEGVANVTGLALLGSALFGGVSFIGAGIGELVNRKKIKESFRQLKPSDAAALLAMKATLLDHGMASMSPEECKKELDECLAGLNDFRADAEYMLIVEKSDADASKKKIQICNRFVNRLASIAGI